MNSRRRRDVARQIVAIRDIQKLVTEQARLAADHKVTRQQNTVHEANGQLECSKTQWDEHMASERLLPEFMTALSGEVIDREQACQTERQKLQGAQRSLEICVREAATCAGLREQAEEMLKRTRRKIAAEEEQRAQTGLEERTTYRWSQP